MDVGVIVGKSRFRELGRDIVIISCCTVHKFVVPFPRNCIRYGPTPPCLEENIRALNVAVVVLRAWCDEFKNKSPPFHRHYGKSIVPNMQ